MTVQCVTQSGLYPLCSCNICYLPHTYALYIFGNKGPGSIPWKFQQYLLLTDVMVSRETARKQSQLEPDGAETECMVLKLVQFSTPQDLVSVSM